MISPITDQDRLRLCCQEGEYNVPVPALLNLLSARVNLRRCVVAGGYTSSRLEIFLAALPSAMLENRQSLPTCFSAGKVRGGLAWWSIVYSATFVYSYRTLGRKARGLSRATYVIGDRDRVEIQDFNGFARLSGHDFHDGRPQPILRKTRDRGLVCATSIVELLDLNINLCQRLAPMAGPSSIFKASIGRYLDIALSEK
ncbi:hypothetical protein An07g00870 [Aspergillus niger]|uniref:Uncharacterized protein n=2 Tax=Aspergillus niger TaxID=5061 RepID=A2QM56_ASPNC|nr:hypothetical protein An07g00870 [Aspergillus niger]CAK96537.1 hypothetical protein An07g00870 [Aspergillus niger]